MARWGAEICVPDRLHYSGAITGLLNPTLPNSAPQVGNLVASSTSELERDTS